MDKAQASIEVRKIFEWCQEQCDQIVKEAKRNGTWSNGLDANGSLFAELNEETKQKLTLLYSMIDEN